MDVRILLRDLELKRRFGRGVIGQRGAQIGAMKDRRALRIRCRWRRGRRAEGAQVECDAVERGDRHADGGGQLGARIFFGTSRGSKIALGLGIGKHGGVDIGLRILADCESVAAHDRDLPLGLRLRGQEGDTRAGGVQGEHGTCAATVHAAVMMLSRAASER